MFSHVDQCVTVSFDGSGKRHQHGVVDSLLAQAPQNEIRDPHRRVVEVNDLQHRLQQVELQVPPLPVRQLVDQDKLQLLLVKTAHEALGNENRRPPESADGRATDLV